MAISERTFGVEIECGHPKIRWDEIGQRLTKEKRFGNRYSVGSDGSGIEVRTPILRGEEGFAELHDVMNYLRDDLGCFVARDDGMHVHIGAEGFSTDEEACKVLMRTWYHNQDLIESMVSSHRAGMYVCSKVANDEANKFGQYMSPPERKQKYWGPRMRALGLSSIPRRGTIECRLHEGCLNPVKAQAWVQFIQAMLDHAIQKREVLTCKTKIALLKGLSVPEDAIEVLRKRQPTMPVNAGANTAW